MVAFAAAAILLAACSKPQSESACIADSVPTLYLLPSATNCAANQWICRVQCTAGSAGSCLGLAYHLQTRTKDNEDEALRLYRRACLLGEANACTNYAAGALWTADRDSTCARRMFEKSCAAREPFACGMVGRVMLENTTPPRYAEGRKYLEDACNKIGGFPCRVLAKHLETGKLGDYDPKSIRTLLTQACEGGDPDACGDPETAAETFR